MEPFRIVTSLEKLVDAYPDPKVLLNAALEGGKPAQNAIARLWLSEGIPYAFNRCPALYESVRWWLSKRLNVHAKEISLVGSARLGKSYAAKQLGRPFDNESDLDLFIVSSDLFQKLKKEFYLWLHKFETEQITPKSDAEKKYWPENKNKVPGMIKRGFIDTKYIPNHFDYPTTQGISQTMWRLVERLKITPCAPKPKFASVRCYSSWNSFVQQSSLNLNFNAVKK